ncbi:MAG: tetratricopeptide repeat protein [Terriglobales bacterium]
MDIQHTDSSARSWIERAGVAETIVCAITALVYLATLSFGFVYDDVPQILKNPAVHEWRFVPQYFTSHVWAAIYPNTSGNYYRPVFLLWLRMNYALFGASAAGWHLTSLACHVLATWLVFRVVRQLARDRAIAFVAALIFGLHPAHIENVAWISGVTDPLMACFVLGSFSAFLEFRRSGGIGRAALSLALFAPGLLSKETAIVLPAAILAYLLILGRDGEWGSGPEGGRDAASAAGGTPALRSVGVGTLGLLVGLVAVVLGYFVVRFYALRGWSHSTITIGWKEVFFSWPSVVWFYVTHLVWPARLSEFYSLDYISHATAGAVFVPLAYLLITAIVAAVVVRFIRERFEKRLARFGFVLLIVPLLPVLDLRSLTAGDIVHDRYLYLPSVGFALLVALLIRELGRCLPEARRGFVAVVAVAAVAGLFAVLTFSQQMQWASDILLYSRGLESAPANLTVRDNLANALLDASQPERAIPLYLEVISRNPAFWRSNYNLGFAYYETGNFAAAEDYLRRAILIDPSDSDQYIYLALTQIQLKRLPEAAENARRAITISPHARGYHSVAGLVYETAGDRPRAMAEFRLEVAEHPDNAAAVAALQKLENTTPMP